MSCLFYFPCFIGNCVLWNKKRSARMRTCAKQKHVASDRARRENVPRHILFQNGSVCHSFRFVIQYNSFGEAWKGAEWKNIWKFSLLGTYARTVIILLLYTGRHFWNRKCRKKTWWQQEFAVFKCEATANSVTGHVCVYSNRNAVTEQHFGGTVHGQCQ